MQALFDRYIDANSVVTGLEKEETLVLSTQLPVLLLLLSCCCLQALFDRYIDANSVVTGLEKEEASVLKSKRITPKMFAHSIKQRCIKNPQRIVLPEVRKGAQRLLGKGRVM